MIFCARATHGLRRMGRVAWPSSCSRNAHDQNVLVRRAQSRIDQATLENVMGIGKMRAGGNGTGSVSTLNYAGLPRKGRAAGTDRVMKLGVGMSLDIRFECGQRGLRLVGQSRAFLKWCLAGC